MKKAKDKAKELVDKFISSERVCECWCECTIINCGCSVKQKELDSAKECALICVDEMIARFQNIPDIYCLGSIIIDEIQYWREVKQEIKQAEI